MCPPAVHRLLLLMIAATGCRPIGCASPSPPKDAAKAAPGAIKPLRSRWRRPRSRGPALGRTVGSLLAWTTRRCAPSSRAPSRACVPTSGTRGRGARCGRVRRPRVRAGGGSRPRPISSHPGVARTRAGHRRGQRGRASPRQGRPGFPRGRVKRTESGSSGRSLELERNGTLFRGGLIAARDVDNARNSTMSQVSDGRRHLRRDQHPDQMRIARRRSTPTALPSAWPRPSARASDARDRQEAAWGHHHPRALAGVIAKRS